MAEKTDPVRAIGEDDSIIATGHEQLGPGHHEEPCRKDDHLRGPEHYADGKVVCRNTGLNPRPRHPWTIDDVALDSHDSRVAQAVPLLAGKLQRVLIRVQSIVALAP